ncbi:Alpha/Beta hydrolase protein [Myxozyma melibiosi]|uniref:Alpha/Beta hydrolase protein n=1 Tax=Myxozyma melibiosi TaxID=54550 RepID=A0ABR1F257_9ASCO
MEYLLAAAAVTSLVIAYLIRRARALSPLEKSLLADPLLGDSPLTVRDSEIETIEHHLPSRAGTVPVKVRVVHVKGTTTRNPHPARLPAFVLVHGLGGQLAQFDALVDFFAYYADVLTLDLPGHGGAPVDGKLSADVYTTPSIARLVVETVNQKLGSERDVVLVGHSLGCAVVCRIAASGELMLAERVRGVVAICPPAPLSAGAKRMQKLAPWIPAGVFDVFRYSDRKGGLHSPSVSRMLGVGAGDEDEDEDEDRVLRRRQLRWNLQVNTAVWLRMAAGARVPELEDWQRVRAPCCFIAGEADKVTHAANAVQIVDAMRSARQAEGDDTAVRITVIPRAGHMCLVDRHQLVCGIINDFIVDCVDERLSLGWQLADLATRDDKWSLKNEAKWRSIDAVSEVVGGGSGIRAMKTLRQDDAEQNPTSLEERYRDITDIIDISRDLPPYDPATFKRIRYHKFPTVSKIPPSRQQVDEFIALVDSLEYDPTTGARNANVVAVHCHYGFNRTGFLICSYLVQRLGVPVRDAVEYFKVARPPGIKHPHFIDELYVRYTL